MATTTITITVEPQRAELYNGGQVDPTDNTTDANE